MKLGDFGLARVVAAHGKGVYTNQVSTRYTFHSNSLLSYFLVLSLFLFCESYIRLHDINNQQVVQITRTALWIRIIHSEYRYLGSWLYILFYFILFYFILFYFILFYFILFYFILFYFILYY